MGNNGQSYTCENHPNLRWFTTKPGGKLTFAGELPTPEHPTGRPDYAGGMLPFKVLKARMEGYNPYFPSMKDEDGPTITTWDDILEFVDYIKSIEERWAFECDCSPDLLRPVDDDANEYLSQIRLTRADGTVI